MNKQAYEDITGNQLINSGENWRTLCFAHFEGTPSLYIHKTTSLCHCFGCGLKGYIDTCLSRSYEIPASQIRKRLGIEAIDRMHMTKDEPEPVFSKAWLSGFKKITQHPFLKKRGFKETTIRYHQARWDPEGRVVFPLKSLGGPVAGAAGRTVTDVLPKWYFYWNTRPGNILYQATDTLQLDIIVEGIFDVMWLNQYGYQGAVALLGDQASKKQVELIKGNTDAVLLLLDNDKAGNMGTETLAKKLSSSVKCYLPQYPKGKKDPKELTEEELHSVIENKISYVEWITIKN